ncbi:glycosyltransferase family 4 protein [Paracoccus sp. (in: a-proteobacteria)]|uniref:glycosyltransferase family 4 protein n=1 Tax=Paracoccus sp. TaxID=267 RepID=UPI0028A79D61|nr:glycosyltransferase family 4 protein [Paracoccus sp. (in: a-proteobacteria)]
MTMANAAIWYAPDGYDPKSRGINGRRVAGESFLRGLFMHSSAEELVCLTQSQTGEEALRTFAAREGVTRPLRVARHAAPEQIAPVDVVYYPSPNFATRCWQRASLGAAAYALCGITHTISTRAIMQGMFDLRTAPQMPWDAVICTSKAAHASLMAQMELSDDWLASRFGGTLPPRPLLPVIPLGINCDDFIPDSAAGKALRERLGIAENEVACAIIARLTPHDKFDPLPLYIALAQAQRQAGRTFHLLLYGQFPDSYSRRIFTDGARALMPEVGFHLLDGADAAGRKATLSGADLFLFPIDNVQETFGLAPIEAMAAGLPVIVTDWSGMKDTVPASAGFRTPTETARSDLTTWLGQRHFDETDSHNQYLGQLSALTRIDLRALTAALVALAGNPGLRMRMGRAAQAHARASYDWKAVIPAYEALWAEQSAMLGRVRAGGSEPPPLQAARIPPHPAPGAFFSGYPSRSGPNLHSRFRATPAATTLPSVLEMLMLRDYAALKRMIAAPGQIEALLTAVAAAGSAGATLQDLARNAHLPERPASRAILWLLKYGYVEEAE